MALARAYDIGAVDHIGMIELSLDAGAPPAITAGYPLVGMMIMGVVLGAWKK